MHLIVTAAKESTMFTYIWPIVLVILSNTVYHVCAKSTPTDMSPFASLTITYLIGAAASAVLYFALNRGGNLFKEYTKVNWAPFVLGLVIVGLEVGSIYVYRAGWTVSTANIVENGFLAVVLMLVGYLVFKETITWTKVAGMAICLFGLYLINK